MCIYIYIHLDNSFKPQHLFIYSFFLPDGRNLTMHELIVFERQDIKLCSKNMHLCDITKSSASDTI